MKKLLVLLLHGMGEITRAEFDATVNRFAKDLEGVIGASIAERVHCDMIYYQDLLNENERNIYNSMNCAARLDWQFLRSFMLFGFSDAASLESRANSAGSVYEQVQARIAAALRMNFVEIFHNVSVPVVVVAHSLGCQVLSNYIWDSQQQKPSQGIWHQGQPGAVPAGSPLDGFLRLKTLHTLYTIGCNIPIFIAGKPHIRAIETAGSGYDFRWYNFYDPDDVLGWPLRPLAVGYDGRKPGTSYGEAVAADVAINAHGSWPGLLLRSWNPLSHQEYWRDKVLLRHVGQRVREVLPA